MSGPSGEWQQQNQAPMPPMSGIQNPEHRQRQQQQMDQLQASFSELTNEDKALIRQVNREIFWQKSVPLMTVLAGAVVFANHRGLIKSGVKSKAIGAAFGGYVFTKLSTVSVLEERFLKELPHSQVSKIVRQKRNLPEPEFEAPSEVPSSQEFVNPSDSFAPPPNAQAKTDESGMSYDMIREQHRQRYRPVFQQPPSQQQPASMPPYHGVPPPVAAMPPPPGPEDSIPVQRRPRGSSTNKYGDEGFE